MRRYIWFLVLLLLFIPSTIFLFFIMKPEHFQTENNICVTVKGSFNGCYFIPYKYNSILPPKTDYIKAKSGHAGGLTVDFLSPTNVVLRFDNVDMWKVNMSNIKYVIDSNDYYSHVESLYPVVRYIFPFDTYIHPSIAERKNDSTYIYSGLNVNSCAHTPQKIERYIKNHCDLRTVDTCFIDLSQALETDYDTMYVFNSLIPLTGIQNIIGIKDYGKCKKPEMTLIGHDSETCRIILVKNNKVVYDDEYNFNDYNTKISFRDFSIVYGEGLFDGSIVKVSGYMYLDQFFMVTKKSDGQYLLEITEGVL